MVENLPKQTWRLIQTPPAAGAWNMAVDEAILEAIGKEAVLPTLRLYAWDPPCLSLGFAQLIADVDQVELAQKGWGLVRRPTGGRAILHTDELTYSVVGPQHEPRLTGSVLESYQRLSKALLKALDFLNLPARSESGSILTTNGSKGPVCFETPSNYEITAGGKKLIGSAQARRKEGVLQHGSLPLYGDLARITEVLRFSGEEQVPVEEARRRAASRLYEHATTVEACLGVRPTWENAAKAFISAFTEVLNLELIPSELTAGEIDRAERLVATKYHHPSWTDRV